MPNPNKKDTAISYDILLDCYNILLECEKELKIEDKSVLFSADTIKETCENSRKKVITALSKQPPQNNWSNYTYIYDNFELINNKIMKPNLWQKIINSPNKSLGYYIGCHTIFFVSIVIGTLIAASLLLKTKDGKQHPPLFNLSTLLSIITILSGVGAASVLACSGMIGTVLLCHHKERGNKEKMRKEINMDEIKSAPDENKRLELINNYFPKNTFSFFTRVIVPEIKITEAENGTNEKSPLNAAASLPTSYGTANENFITLRHQGGNDANDCLIL